MEQVKLFFRETIEEMLYKVTWPSWQDLQSSTMIVLISVIIFSLIIFIFDFIFGANPENGLFEGILYYVYQLFS